MEHHTQGLRAATLLLCLTLLVAAFFALPARAAPYPPATGAAFACADGVSLVWTQQGASNLTTVYKWSDETQRWEIQRPEGFRLATYQGGTFGWHDATGKGGDEYQVVEFVVSESYGGLVGATAFRAGACGEIPPTSTAQPTPTATTAPTATPTAMPTPTKTPPRRLVYYFPLASRQR